ncbi:MAG TPA: PP2C family protein-serine/threonine phosphatase, partial [Actinomycetota bacterium]|nr:PP2C family protein-serine/threonine phosphatase [Actinomycetota bacterium]
FCTVVQGFLSKAGDGMRLRFTVAGHPLPILMDASGRLRTIGTTGSLIGAFREAHLYDEEIVLREGEALILYTDGVVEGRSPDGRMQPDLIERTLGTLGGRSADQIADALEGAALEHQGGTNRDDMALLVMRVSTQE